MSYGRSMAASCGTELTRRPSRESATFSLNSNMHHAPEGVSWADWERVLAARRAKATIDLPTLRGLGPKIAPGQVLLTLDEVLTPARESGRFHEVRTACLCTTECRRY